MGVQPLRMRRLPANEAQVRQRLGAGLSLALSAPEPATLQLRLAPAPFGNAPTHAVDCSFGRLWLDDAPALLNQLSSCPAILPEPASQATDNDWYWSLFNQYLAPQLQVLLGPLRWVKTAPGEGLDCTLELTTAQGLRHISQTRIAPDVLLALLENGQWQPTYHKPSNDWPVRLQLLLGHCPLGATQLRSLRTGDVVLVDQPLFNAQGVGSLQIAASRLHLQMLPGPSLRFTLVELEDLPMNAPHDHFACSDSEQLAPLQLQEPNSGDEQTTEDDEARERFDDLPLNLTLHAGHLTLSLGQLRHLSAGSVLTFSGCALGEALLCLGERTLAKGELVDVDGRIGLRITALEPQR